MAARVDDLQIDGLALVDDDAERGAAARVGGCDRPGVQGLAARRGAEGATAPWSRATLSELDATQLAEHLEQVAKAAPTTSCKSSLRGRRRSCWCLQRTQTIARFTPRLGERLGAEAPAPQSDGYALHGVATAAEPRYGTLRPVYARGSCTPT